MSHAEPYPLSPFELMSLEEQIEYVEANVDSIISSLMANQSIPLRHREILAKQTSRYRWEIENAITWEEFEKELRQR